MFLGISPWTVLILTEHYCMSRGSQALTNPQVSWPSSFPGLPSDFSNLWGLGQAFSFLCIMRSETCSFMDLGPCLWTLNGFGPLFLFSLLEAQLFYLPGLQSLRCFGPWFNIVIFWTSTIGLVNDPKTMNLESLGVSSPQARDLQSQLLRSKISQENPFHEK